MPVVAMTSCILEWFQGLGKDSGKGMTSVIYLRQDALRSHICEDELTAN